MDKTGWNLLFLVESEKTCKAGKLGGLSWWLADLKACVDIS